VKYFSELISLLYKKYNPYILINSGPIDKEVTEELTKALSEKGIQNKILYKSIRVVGAIIAKSDLFISNDTGTMHVGAMVNAKVIGLFGPTNAYEWGPLNENGAFIQSKSRDINDITVEEVFEKACELLNK
jgi:heptosyltransferase-2